jgi:predicted alpha/beta hydrolase
MAVAVALGSSVAEAFGRWHAWVSRQRDVLICGKLGVTTKEYETVARVFAAVGITVLTEEPRRD